MDEKIVFGRILQKFIDKGKTQVKGYNSFCYKSHSKNKLVVSREEGQDTDIYFDKILLAIQHYKIDPDDYDHGPSRLRSYGITHVNSPVWSLLHLLDKEDYL